jgi:alanyl-tRNA synthetase
VVNGVRVLAARMDGLDMDTLRSTVDHFKDRLGSGVVLLASVAEGKVAFACGVTKDLAGKHKAGDLVKKVAAVCGGSGGGKPEMATAGGRDAARVDAALDELLKLIGET